MTYQKVPMFELRVYQDIDAPEGSPKFVGAFYRTANVFARTETGEKGEFLRTKKSIHIFGFGSDTPEEVREKAVRYWDENQAKNAAAHDAKELAKLQAQSRRKKVVEVFANDDGAEKSVDLRMEV